VLLNDEADHLHIHLWIQFELEL